MVARPPGSSIDRTVSWRSATKPAHPTRRLRLGFALRKGTFFAGIQKLLRVETTEKLDQLCDHAGPTGLMTGPEARAVIAVEVLVEQDVILPVGIGLEFLRAAVHRTPAGFIPQEDPLQTIGYFMGDLEQVHQFARAGGTLDFEVVTVIEIEREHGADQHHVYRHPYRPTPVGISTEHAGVGFGR